MTPQINRTIWKLYRDGYTAQQIADSLEFELESVVSVIAQMPTTSEKVANDIKTKFAEHQDMFIETIAEIAQNGDNDFVKLNAAKFGVLVSHGHFDPKKNEENTGISIVQINNIIAQGREAYEKQLKKVSPELLLAQT